MSTESQRNMQFFDGADAPNLFEVGMMAPPDLNPEIYQTLDLSPLAGGDQSDVLFEGAGPAGFSLVRARFKPGYRLPRHSHSADCLYYIVSGELTMGARTIKAGSGFFVRADAPYAYQAGPDGVEVLEFRTATRFDMVVYDQTPERWQPIVEAAVANADRWATTSADS